MKIKNLLLTLTLFAVLLLAACGGSDKPEESTPDENDADNAGQTEDADNAEAKGELAVVSWGGLGTDAQRAAWYEPFMEETGIKIVEVTPPSTAQLKAQVDSGNVEWDVVLMDKSQIDLLALEGDYLENIDYDAMDQDLLAGIPDEAKKVNGLGAYYWAWALAYRTDDYADNPPTGWKDFYDLENFKGKRSMPDQPHSTFEIALLADGVDEEDIYPIDVDRAFSKIEQITPEINAFWKAGAEGVQMLADKEVSMAHVFTVQAGSLIKQGVPLEIVWDQGLYAMDYWVVPKGQMSEEAIKFLEFISRPENQGALANEAPYGPIHEDSLQFVDEEMQKNVVTNPDNLSKLIPYDSKDYWGEHRETMQGKWEEWKLDN